MEDEREIRLTIEELEALLKNAKLVTLSEAVNRAWIEPGELVINIAQ